MGILSTKGVSKEMKFTCCSCGDAVTGEEVLDGAYLYIIKADKENIKNSLFRCECCQDDFEDRE